MKQQRWIPLNLMKSLERNPVSQKVMGFSCMTWKLDANYVLKSMLSGTLEFIVPLTPFAIW
jgi:hypothetical protein